MAVKRYFANKDNTITNAYEYNLKTRATGANMGQADILEVFSIYGQVSSSSGFSSELERILIQFPTTDIVSDRTAGTIPASGSVNFYLKMYNAPHTQTTPKDYTLTVKAISGSWEEGHGLDMDNYTDIVYDNPGSNWIVANDDTSAATATVTFTGNPTADQTITIVSTDGTSREYVAKAASDFSNLQFKADGGAAANATQLELAIENSAGHNGKITVSNNGSGVLTLTQASAGRAGNRAIVEDLANVTVVNFLGGDGEWVSEGGDYYTDSSSSFDYSFDLGTEDMDLDVTTLVEQWLNSAGNVLGTKANNGFGIMLSTALEAQSRSYYTKKFFGRGTEFFYKRPVLEARWNSSRQDDRGNFYYSSSLAPAEDNLNTLYLYNYVRGKLRNIPAIGTTGSFLVSLYSGSADDSAPSGSRLHIAQGGGCTHADGVNFFATGGYVDTGIYSASFAMTAAATPLATMYDVWTSGSGDGTNSIRFFTGSFSPITLYASRINPTNTYVTTITNLKSLYTRTETARFRLFVREKDWSPTIYTKASSNILGQTIVSGSYRVYRIVDELDVIPHGTGSTLETLMSYDITGSYFDLDMSILQADYAYGIEFSYYNDAIGSWVKQPEIFKFRVE
jgi:hypothetical protein